MKYKPTKQVVKDDSIVVTVEYTFSDGSTQVADVNIFRPQSVDDVIRGIENLGVSEESKISASIEAHAVADEFYALIGNEVTV